MPKINLEDMPAGAMELRRKAERLEQQAALRNPVIEQALMQGVRQQGQAAMETAEQAAGLTGAAQIGAVGMQQLALLGQARMQVKAQQNEQMLAAISRAGEIETKAAELESRRYETNLQHRQFEMQLEEQRKQQSRGALLGAGAGLLTGFMGSNTFDALFGNEAAGTDDLLAAILGEGK